jgi:hypothetical protein
VDLQGLLRATQDEATDLRRRCYWLECQHRAMPMRGSLQFPPHDFVPPGRVDARVSFQDGAHMPRYADHQRMEARETGSRELEYPADPFGARENVPPNASPRCGQPCLAYPHPSERLPNSRTPQVLIDTHFRPQGYRVAAPNCWSKGTLSSTRSFRGAS